MLSLSANNLNALSDPVPWPVDLIKIILDTGSVLRLTNHFHELVISGDGTYVAAGEFLAFSDIEDNIEVKYNSLDISLSGVGSSITAAILSNPVEGSRVDVFRGFYDQATGDLVDPPFGRWSGRINNYSITDDYQFTNEDRVVISISCKSLLNTILTRVSGRYTSPQSFQSFTTDDQSMEFTPSLPTFNPNFGAEE
jgi:hypothetical protein